MQNKCNSILSPARTQAAQQIWAVWTTLKKTICVSVSMTHWVRLGIVLIDNKQKWWVGYCCNSRLSENRKIHLWKSEKTTLSPAPIQAHKLSAPDVDSADRPSDTNLIKVGGKCESQTETHHNFPAHLPSLNCPRFDRVHWVQSLGGKAWGDNDSRRDQPHLWCFEQQLNVKQIRAGVGG